MSTTDPYSISHPEELLGAYALDILDEAEAIEVEAHLDACAHCRDSAASLRVTTAAFGEAVGRQAPPSFLLGRIMGALPEVQPEAAPPTLVDADGRTKSRLARALLPLAAVLVLGLLTYNLVANFLLSAQVDELQRQNATLTRLEKLAAEDSQVIDSLNELRGFANYWLADSPSRPLILEPPGRIGESEGILLVTDDGRRALLMVAGMTELPEPLSYQIWFKRQNERVWVGQLKVDSRGWGTVTLHPKEPLFGFDSVMLTTDVEQAQGRRQDEMVLQGQIIAQRLDK